MNLNTFSLGTHSNGTFGTNTYSALNPSFEPLIVSSALTTDTPLLYEALVLSKIYATGALVQRDALGSPIAVWALEKIFVSDATFSGFGDASNEQEITFRFASITEATKNASASWSRLTSSEIGPAIPSGLTLSPIPTKASELSLKLYTSIDGTFPTFTIPLDDFVFGSNVTALVGAGATAFDQLVVTSQLQDISPTLFAALLRGRRFGKVTLTKDSASGPLTIATMGDVYITDDLISGDAETLPIQQFKLLYSQITQSAAGVSTSWDILRRRADGPVPLTGPDLSSLPASTGSILFELKAKATDQRPSVSINLDSLKYGFDKIPNGVGLDNLTIRTLPGSATPVLFAALARQSRFELGQITQYNASGAIVSQLTIGDVLLLSNRISGLSNGELVDEYGLTYTTFRQQVGTATAVWNFVTGREEFGGPAINAASVASGSLPTGEAPANSLVLELRDGTNPAIIIPLNTLDYAYENLFQSGLPVGSNFGPLSINFDLTNSAPGLFAALAQGKIFRDASIKKFEGDRLVAGWLISNALVQSDDTTSVGSQTTKSLTLTYSSLVNIASTETKLSTSSPSITYGQALTFTASVTSSGVAVTSGSVLFSVGSTQLASVSVNAAGQASYTTSSLNVAGSPYNIEALYVPSTTLIPSSASVGVSVSAATLTITPADNQSKIYGDALPALNFTASGLVNNDPSTLLTGHLGTTATVSSPVGSYPFTLGTLSAGTNYNLTLANNSPTFSVTAATLTIAPDAGQSKSYGSPVPALSFTASGFKNNDAASIVVGLLGTTANDSSSVGSYPFTIGSLSAGNNYVLALADSAPSFTVTTAKLTIQPNTNQFKIYGDDNPLLTFTSSGLKNNDQPSIIVGELSTSAVVTSGVGRYTFGLGTLSAGNNYTLELAIDPPTFEVKPATLTITPAANQSKVYGSPLPTLVYGVSGLKNNDASSIVVGQLGTTATASSNVGDYAFTLNTLNAGDNYTLVLSPELSKFTVVPAPLRIIADDKTKTFGADNPTLTATISGLVNNDTSSVVSGLVLATTATKFSPPSTTPYPITASGATAANYQIQFIAGKLTITGGNLIARGTTFTPTAGAPFQGRLASFTNPDPLATINSYTALITWGDGTTSNGTILQSGNEFVVNGSRTYSTAGTYAVRVLIRHKFDIASPTEVSSTAVVTRLGFGQTQNTDYWRDQAGQNLINSFNESMTSTRLGNWLSTSFPRLYGIQAGSNNLSGRTNVQVAAYYLNLFKQSSNALEREVLATALNIYASTLNLGGAAGARAGFQVTLEGLGATSVNVGLRGSSFGVPNNTSLTVLNLLNYINSRMTGSILYSSAPPLRAGAQQVLSQVNEKGKIGIDENQAQSSGFWSGSRGQGLIRSFNGGSTATQLSSWLSETLPNLFGALAGTRNLTGRTNAQVAQAFSLVEDSKRDRAYAQVFALALNVYASTQSLGGSSSQSHIKVSPFGLGAAEFNISVYGAVAGVVNGSTINVYSYLRGVNRLAVGGVLYNGNSRLTALAEDVTKRLND